MIMIKFTQSYNRYSYALNNPLKYVDPSGEWAIDVYDHYLDLKTGRVISKPDNKDYYFEGLIHLAPDNASMQQIEEALRNQNFNFQKNAAVDGGYMVDTEMQYKGWVMMQTFNPETVGTLFSLGAMNMATTVTRAASRLFNMGSKAANAVINTTRTTMLEGVEVTAKAGPYTRSNLHLGRMMHDAYKVGDVVDGVAIKEFRRISGIRPDFVDFSTKTIYELKPNNPRSIQQGWLQLNRYKSVFETEFPNTT